MKLFNKFKTLFLSAAIVLGVCTTPAIAQQNDDFSDVTHMSLVPGWVRADGIYVAAILVELAPGWKTYWRSAGASGISPTFDWSGSENIAQVGYVWPTPTVFSSYGARTIGYENQLLLPILIKPQTAGAPIRAALTMDYGICKQVCLSTRGQAQVEFAPSKIANKKSISSAMKTRAASAKSAGILAATCSIRPNGQDFVLSATLKFEGAPSQAKAVVIETGSELIWVSEPDHRIEDRMVSIEADIQYYGDGAMSLNRSALRFTLIGENSSIDVRGCTGG